MMALMARCAATTMKGTECLVDRMRAGAFLVMKAPSHTSE